MNQASITLAVLLIAPPAALHAAGFEEQLTGHEAALLAKYRPPAGVVATGEPSAFIAPGVKAGPEKFNYVIGTQTFRPAYQFTKASRLVETAEAIRTLGCTVIKFELAPRYARGNGNVPTPMPALRSLADLARDEPSHRQVLDMPFVYFVLWAHTFSGGEGKWRKGFAQDAAEKEYREMYDLTVHLLKTYSGSGKIFCLGHWEGDGFLRGSVAPENDAKVTPEAVQGMVDWLNTRQRAVDDAKRDTPHERVQVWHYTEVNHVKLAMQGRPALVNEVLPKTTVDLVSYSTYDTQYDPAQLKAALNFIESKLPTKAGITGRRVFIGEYGFPTIRHTPQEQDRLSSAVIQAGLEWGCPLVLYWELYNNEVDPDGQQRGFWLIDDKGAKQPVYETHRRFLQQARQLVADRLAKTSRPPTFDEFRRAAVAFLNPAPHSEDTLPGTPPAGLELRQAAFKAARPSISDLLAVTELQLDMKMVFVALPDDDPVTARFIFDPFRNEPRVQLRRSWQDVDVAHELMHARMDLIDGFSMLAWRRDVPHTPEVEAAFARVQTYVKDEVVHANLAKMGLRIDGEIIRPTLFDSVYANASRYLEEGRDRPNDGMAHMDKLGRGTLCRVSFLVQAELLLKNYRAQLPQSRIEQAGRFIRAFRARRPEESEKADAVLTLFQKHDVQTPAGNREILAAWAKMEGLDHFVSPSSFRKNPDGRYILPFPE